MSRKVSYAEWPESQIMHGCSYCLSVGNSSDSICTNVDNCICLQLGYTRDEDKLPEDPIGPLNEDK